MSIYSIVYALEEWDTTAESPATFGDLEIVFSNILSVITTVAGFGLFIMLLVGGFQFLTAGDSPEKAQQAQKTLTNAVLGLGLIILTWFIFLLIENFTGVTITEFKIMSD
jgi:predicted small integral membrane protein